MDSRRLLREAGLRPRKGLGQNFLTDMSVPARIADAAELVPTDTVIEVGPGLGVLTLELASRLDLAGCLVAVELDADLIRLLRERLATYPQVRLVHGDVLALTPADLLAPCGGRPEYKVVANLPYYITSAVLRHFLSAVQRPTRLVVMVQREVAERIVAKPPEMSLLAVSVQYHGAPSIVFRVPPGAFHPPPKVESAVVRIDVFPPGGRPVSVADEAQFFAVVRAGFGQKRKQLGNTLSEGLRLPKPDALDALARAGVEPTRRAETLTLHEWAALARVLQPAEGEPPPDA